jgi:hypothetical protein
MNSRLLAFIETPFQASEFCAYIIKHNINLKEVKIICSDSLLIINILKIYNIQDEIRLVSFSNMLIIRSIIKSFFRKKEVFFLGSLVGLRNVTLAMFLRSKKIIVFDDGMNTLHRKKEYLTLISLIRFILNINNSHLTFFSIFPKTAKSQRGDFKIDLKEILKDKALNKNMSTYNNTCFYLCSYSIEDGLGLDKEHELIKKLISFAKKSNQELIILPHRRDMIKKSKSYIFSQKVMNHYSGFESFYSLNNFNNCSFITLYSTAILYVGDSHPKYFINNMFKPNFKKTFIQKFFFLNGPSTKEIYEYFLKNNIKEIIYKNL